MKKNGMFDVLSGLLSTQNPAVAPQKTPQPSEPKQDLSEDFPKLENPYYKILARHEFLSRKIDKDNEST